MDVDRELAVARNRDWLTFLGFVGVIALIGLVAALAIASSV